MTSRFVRVYLAGFAALVLASAAVPIAGHASTYFFTQDGSDGQSLGGNLPAPGYGQVDVTTVGSDLEFIVQLAPNWSVDTGTHHAFTFSLATSGLTISGSSGAVSALTSPFVQASGSSFGNPGFNGPFNYAINCSGGGNGANSCNQVNSLTFFVLGAGALNLVQTNGVFMTADIFGNSSGQTGVVGATTAPVPGPLVGAGLPGLVAGCGGLLALVRRRRGRVA